MKVVYFAPVCEWNDFVGFNGFLHSNKSRYEDLIVVAPRKALPIITAADSFITLDESIDRPENTYPAVLEEKSVRRMVQCGDLQVIATHGRNKSELFDRAMQYVCSDEQQWLSDYKVRLYEQEVDLYNSDAVSVYGRLFRGLRQMIRDGVRIKPTKAVYDRISGMYRHLTHLTGQAEKTVMVLTRNYKNKAPEENTSVLIPNMKDVLEALVNEGVNVINVGFPCQSYDIQSSPWGARYQELSNPDLTQDELVALMYDCDSVIMSGRSGGFSAHVLSNADIFMAHQEWSVWNKDINIEVFETRKTCNSDVSSVDLANLFEQNNVDGIVEAVLQHKKLATNTFGAEKPTVYLR